MTEAALRSKEPLARLNLFDGVRLRRC
jgi:hypothetical protein